MIDPHRRAQLNNYPYYSINLSLAFMQEGWQNGHYQYTHKDIRLLEDCKLPGHKG